MAVGIMCAKINWVDEHTNKKLSTILLMMINPIAIFLSYQRSFETELLLGLGIAFGLSLISFVFTIFVSEIIYRKKNHDFSIEKFSLVYTNSGFMGIPLVNGIFGSEGVFYLTAYLTAFFIFFWTHGMITMSGKKDIQAIKKAIVSPPMWAIYIGFILFIANIQLPAIIYLPMRTLANINTPLAMIVAGASIFGTSIKKLVQDKRLWIISLLKLVLLPLIQIVFFNLFELPSLVVGTVVVLAACPVAANIIMFAYRYDKNPVFASQSFAVTTVLSLVTIPVLLFFL